MERQGLLCYSYCTAVQHCESTRDDSTSRPRYIEQTQHSVVCSLTRVTDAIIKLFSRAVHVSYCLLKFHLPAPKPRLSLTTHAFSLLTTAGSTRISFHPLHGYYLPDAAFLVFDLLSFTLTTYLSTIAASPDMSFRLFPKLPKELRLQIWRHACTAPQLVHLGLLFNDSGETSCVRCLCYTNHGQCRCMGPDLRGGYSCDDCWHCAGMEPLRHAECSDGDYRLICLNRPRLLRVHQVNSEARKECLRFTTRGVHESDLERMVGYRTFDHRRDLFLIEGLFDKLPWGWTGGCQTMATLCNMSRVAVPAFDVESSPENQPRLWPNAEPLGAWDWDSIFQIIAHHPSEWVVLDGDTLDDRGKSIVHDVEILTDEDRMATARMLREGMAVLTDNLNRRSGVVGEFKVAGGEVESL